MNDYQDYISSLTQQPLQIKQKSLIAELKQLRDENSGLLHYFKGVNNGLETFMNSPQSSIEELTAFLSTLKERLPLLEQLKQNLDELN